MSLSDPVYLEIREIVCSASGQAAALDATAKGLPALSGVDLLLRKALGAKYTKDDQGLQSAGDLVAKLMQQKGYKSPKKQAHAELAA
jgi:hypothetical protein